MRITESARKHGVKDADIEHAIDHVIRIRQQEYGGEERLFLIGADRAGQLLELVVVPVVDPQRVIHADALRHTFYDYL